MNDYHNNLPKTSPSAFKKKSSTNTNNTNSSNHTLVTSTNIPGNNNTTTHQKAQFFHHDGEEYMKKFQMSFYLNDVLSKLIYSRDDDPLQFLANYFKQVISGMHVIHKPYSYIHSTPRNRLSFTDYFEQIYSKISNEQKSSLKKEMNFSEYYQLILLLCDDFPESLMHSLYNSMVMYNTIVKNKDIYEQLPEMLGDIHGSEEKKVIELPAFQSFILCFRTYLFYFEFFELIRDSVFNKSFFIPVPTNIINKSITHILGQLKDSSQEFSKPNTENIQAIIEKAIQLRMKYVNENDGKLGFAEFCEAFYQHVVNVGYARNSAQNQPSAPQADVLSIMDVHEAPISVIGAERQKLRLRKEILKLYSAKDNTTNSSSK